MKKLLAGVSLMAMCHVAVAQSAFPITVPSTGSVPMPTPAGQQQLISGTPWVNGRGAVQGPNWRDNYQIVHDILNGMGTWTPQGAYLPPIFFPTYLGISSFAFSPSTVSFTAPGYASNGDLGSGMPMTRGSSTGPLAKQSADGSWWVLDVKSLPNIPIGYCGLRADGSNDAPGAAQQCADIANATSKLLYIHTGGGTMRLGSSGTININTGVTGDGKTRSYVQNMNPSGNLFYYNSNQTPVFEKVHYLPGPSTPTAGATIFLDGPSGGFNFNADINQNAFQGQYTDVYCNRCNVPRYRNNFSTGYVFASLVLDNLDNTDNGDQVVYGNLLDAGASTTAVGVLQLAAGGLIMTDNKVGNGAQAYRLKLRSGVSTSILKISQNSFENQRNAAVSFTKDGVQDGSGGAFLYADVIDNQISTNAVSVAAIDSEGGKWLVGLKTSHNNINLALGSGPGILFNGGLAVDADDNTFLGHGDATAISVASGVTGRLGPQTLAGVPTLCVCNSMQMTYEGFALMKTAPTPGVPGYISGDAALASGYNVVPTFLYTPPPGANSALIADLSITGTVSGFAASLAKQTIDVSGNGAPLQETLTTVNGPANPNAASGFSFNYPQGANNGPITSSVAFNALAVGTSYTVKMTIKSGAGTFRAY